MKSELVRPHTVSEELWASLTPAQKKAVVEHEKMHEFYLGMIAPGKSVKK